MISPASDSPVLAALEIAGAVGIVLYFDGVLGGHLRVRDTTILAMPIPPLVLSVAVLVLRIATI